MQNKEKNFVSAVVYVHNDGCRAADFVRMLIRVMEANFEVSEIVCVNDFSDDDSARQIKEASEFAKVTTVSVINLSHFHGLESAMSAGVKLAIGDFVLEFDSVLTDYEESKIMEVYYEALTGYDIVSASPEGRQKFTSSLFYFIFDKFTRIPYKMCTERFRILSRRVINRIESMNHSVQYRKALYANCGLNTKNIRYEPIKGVAGKADKEESSYRAGLAVDTLMLFTDVGYKFSITMTICMMLIVVLVVIYSLVIYLTSDPVEGWTTTILFLSFGFLGMFALLSIVIKYLQILVNLVFKRKNYSFENIEKLTK